MAVKETAKMPEDGDPIDFMEWAEELDKPSAVDGFAFDDVGQRMIRAGHAAMPGLAPDFRTDRIMPVHYNVPRPQAANRLGPMVFRAGRIDR